MGAEGNFLPTAEAVLELVWAAAPSPLPQVLRGKQGRPPQLERALGLLGLGWALPQMHGPCTAPGRQ